MAKEQSNRYFRKDIPLLAPEDPRRALRPRYSRFEPYRKKEMEQSQIVLDVQLSGTGKGLLRGKREFAYHVMSLMVKKEYGDVQKALQEMVASDAEWEHKPFIKEVNGEIKQIVPFTDQVQTFAGGFQSTPAEEVKTKEGEPTKVSFEWRTNLY
jgi:hypothetical protein